MTVLADELCPWPRGLLHPGQHNLVGAGDFWYPGILGPGRVRKRYALAVIRMQHLHVVGVTHIPLLCEHLSAGRGYGCQPFAIDMFAVFCSLECSIS